MVWLVVGRWSGWLFGWFAGWLVFWLVGWLVGVVDDVMMVLSDIGLEC